MVLTHSLIGVPITYFLLKNKTNLWKDRLNLNILFLIGIVGSVFPDFDLTLSFFVHDLNHRKLISHSIVPYLILFSTVYFFSCTLKKNQMLIKQANLIFFVTVLSHLLLDYIVGGISLFAPFSINIYGFDIYFEKSSDFFYKYFTSWYMVAEMILMSISMYFIYKLKEIKINLFLPFFFLVIALLMVYKYL